MRILQAIILEWVAISFSRGSSQPRDQTQVSHIADIFFTNWTMREDHGEEDSKKSKKDEGYWKVQSAIYKISHKDAMYSTGHIVNNTVITFCGAHNSQKY